MPTTTLRLLLTLTLLIFTIPPLSSATPMYSYRRSLHQPFFPLLSTPTPPDTPPAPTTAAAAPPPSFPKYPSTTTPTTNPPRPFFPTYPSPPPPPPSQPTLPTFPANISTLSSTPRAPTTRHLAALVAIPAAALAALLLTLTLLLLRRRRHHSPPPTSDSHRLFPPNSTASDGRKLSPSNTTTTPPSSSSDFLYLGTLVNSYADPPAPAPAASTSSPYQKLDSPELRPLPPLARHVRRDRCDGCSSDDEFYSPSAGSPDAENKTHVKLPAAASSSEPGKCPSPVSTLSSPSYPSSNLASSPSPSSSPPISSSPGRSTARSLSSVETAFQPPPPLAPPRLIRPVTPSPPKRRPCSLPLDYATNPFVVSPPPMRPPPPPPPPHAANEFRPPVLLPPRPSGAKNSAAAAAVFPESLENSECVEKGQSNSRPKLKPLHWDKVRASSDREMVWDQLKSSSFELNEEMIATLFGYEAANGATKEASRRQLGSLQNQESRVLDPKKSQNIAILLRALNVTKEEICEALLEGNTDSLGNELLETLLRMAPSKEEELKLKEYKDDSPVKLGPAEKFLKAVLDIPFAFKRADTMLYIANFDSEVNYLRNSFETLEAACEELRSSRMFLKLLEAVLKTGNRMNIGTNRGDAEAFKLNTLLKLVDVKGTDGKTTLLHFVVQEIIKAEGLRLSSANPSTVRTHADALHDDRDCKKLGLQVVSGLQYELSNVKKAATMDSDMLSSYVSRLAGGISKINEILILSSAHSSADQSQNFNNMMIRFLKKAEEGITKIQAQGSFSMSQVKDVTVYFHGGSAKEEAHPFRIFMVVRDFLSILDQVCKEAGKANDRTAVSTIHTVQVLSMPTQPPIFPGLYTLRMGGSDDENSLSS